MSMRQLTAYWDNVEAAGGRPKPVYGVFESESLIYWTVSRQQAVKYIVDRGSGRLVKLLPT